MTIAATVPILPGFGSSSSYQGNLDAHADEKINTFASTNANTNANSIQNVLINKN